MHASFIHLHILTIMHTPTFLWPRLCWGWYCWLAGLLGLLATGAQAQTQFQVTGITPAPRSVNASRTAPIELQFSDAVGPSTWDEITLFATGRHAINTKGTGATNGRTVVVTPATPFRAGEEVS